MSKKAAKRERRTIVRRGICLPLLFIVIALVSIGLVMVYSSTYNSLILGSKDAIKTFKLQAIVAVIGVIIMLFIALKVDYHLFQKPTVIVSGLIICFATLMAVFFFRDSYGAHRWIVVGSTTIQPSEYVKFMMVIYIAAFASKKKWWYTNKKEWIGMLLPVAAMGGMILCEPDLSTTLCYFLVAIALMFISGMQWWIVPVGLGGTAALVPIMVKVTHYQSDRINAWLDPWADARDKGYQIVQSLYALGDGGLFGVGLGNSKQKITHLPMSSTDYIFAIICEEFGFVGGTIVVALYVGLIYYGIKVSLEACDTFGAYLAAGITGIIGLQVFINMAVVTNVIPSTGITLPFISRGASSLGVMLVAMGILLSISAYGKRKLREEAK